MALHYNLAKVYAICEDDQEFVMQIIQLFINEVPEDLEKIKEGIALKNYEFAYSYAHKIKPTLDLLGMENAFDEILQIEKWTKAEGKKKEIIEIFKSMANRIGLAENEIKKDFNL